MNKVKNQHYVPQFLLKRFSENGNDRINVYDKISNKVLLNQSTENFASVNYYYDTDNDVLKENLDLIFKLSKGQYSEKQIEDVKNNEQLIENMLSRSEYETSEYLKKIDNDFGVVNHSDFKVVFYIFARDLAVRTDAYRRQIQKITDKNIEIAQKFETNNIDGYDIALGSKEIAKRKQLNSLTSLPELIRDGNNFLNNYVFYIGVNNTKIPFIISDAPSIQVLVGLNDICFPISPTLAIMMRTVDTKLLTKDEPNKDGIIELSEQSVLLYNTFQFIQAKHFIFGNIDTIKKIAVASKLSELKRIMFENE